MNYENIRKLLKGLITDSTPTEEVEQITKISCEIDNLEKENTEFLTKYEDLRKKYIGVLKDSSFSGSPKEEDVQKPKSLEECFQEQINNRKEK